MKPLRQTVLFLSLLYLTVYLPLTMVIYLPAWYHISCNWNERCGIVGQVAVDTGVAELTDYFLHRGELVTRWSDKERRHLEEVRRIYDGMFVAAIVALLALAWSFDRRLAARFALVNIAVVVTLIGVLPFFRTFWMDVFHPVLFDNELWRTNPADLTWYITPRTYFKYTIVLLITSTVLLNLGVWLAVRRRSGADSPPGGDHGDQE